MDNMKKIILLSLFLFTFLIVPKVHAQDQTKVEAMMKQKCGNAAGPTEESRMCCSNSVKSLFERETAGVNSVIPTGLAFFINAALSLISPTLDADPAMQLLSSPCYNGVPEGTGNACKCVNAAPLVASNPEIRQLCENTMNVAAADNSAEEKKRIEEDRNACIKCAVNDGGFYSGLGCVPGDLAGFISNFVLRIGIGIAGFISLMCIIYSSFLLQVSRGQPEMITKAREQITSCIIGLIMIIFSVFILRLIGVDILRIPGFS
jgi:hypothetical protein